MNKLRRVVFFIDGTFIIIKEDWICEDHCDASFFFRTSRVNILGVLSVIALILLVIIK